MRRLVSCAGVVVGLTMVAGRSVGAQQTIMLPAADKPLSATFASAFTIGADDGESWEMFARVAAVAFDADDNLHVLDHMDPRVLVFDARGRYLRTIGRRGPGPGELQSPNAFALLADGSVVVADLARRAYSRWDRTGKFLNSIPYRDNFVGPTLNGLSVAGTRLLVRPLASHAAGQADGLFPLYRLDLATASGTVAFRFDPPVKEPQTRVEATATGATMRRTALPVLSPTPLMAGFSNGAMAASYSYDYLVRVSGGAREFTIRRAVAPRNVTAVDRARVLRERREVLERDGQISYTFRNGVSSTSSRKLSAAEIEQRLNTMEFATTMPAIQGLLVDGRDVLWIARTPHPGKSTSPIDLVGADGTYMGTIADGKLPAALSRAGLAAYIETHEDGYQQIVVKRLTYTAGGTARPRDRAPAN